MWKCIPGTKCFYSANDKTGEIRSNNRVVEKRGTGQKIHIPGKILKPTIINSGYAKVSLMLNYKRSEHTIHRLVAKTFLKNYDEKLDVNHKDCNKRNNKLSNLEMMTRSENIRHAIAKGVVKPSKRQLEIRANISNIGREMNSKPVHQIDPKTDQVLETYPSASDASRSTGVHLTSISRVALHKQNLAGGYKWEYIQHTNAHEDK